MREQTASRLRNRQAGATSSRAPPRADRRAWRQRWAPRIAATKETPSATGDTGNRPRGPGIRGRAAPGRMPPSPNGHHAGASSTSTDPPESHADLVADLLQTVARGAAGLRESDPRGGTTGRLELPVGARGSISHGMPRRLLGWAGTTPASGAARDVDAYARAHDETWSRRSCVHRRGRDRHRGRVTSSPTERSRSVSSVVGWRQEETESIRRRDWRTLVSLRTGSASPQHGAVAAAAGREKGGAPSRIARSRRPGDKFQRPSTSGVWRCTQRRSSGRTLRADRALR